MLTDESQLWILLEIVFVIEHLKSAKIKALRKGLEKHLYFESLRRILCYVDFCPFLLEKQLQVDIFCFKA